MTANDPLVPPYIERLTPYVPGKPVEELERELGIVDAVKLASNESPLGPSPRAVEAATRALAHGHRYPDQYRLRTALARHHGVTPAEVVLGNGSNELLDIVVRTFGVPGGHAVYPDPSFVVYRSATWGLDMQVSEVPLAGRVHYDVDALIAAVRPDTRLVFLANPNNPTGAYLGRSALSRLLSALPPATIAVIDEAYVEFADAPDFASALDLTSLHPRTVVLRTFSKAYGLAGFRVGYGLAPAKLVGYLDRVRAPFNVSAIALAAAEAALADREHLARYVALNASERTRVTGALTQLGGEVAPSQANFVLARFRVPGRALFERLQEKGVIVRPMPPPIADWVRITLGTPADDDRLLAAVGAVLEESPCVA